MKEKIKKYYYVYRLDHVDSGEFYFGSRGSKYHPTLDKYMGSMVTWKPDKTKLIKTILKDNFETREEAMLCEASLIIENIDDKLNRNYNIPPHNFHSTGKVTVKDKDGNTSSVSINDPRYLSGELIRPWTGRHHSEETKKKISETWKRNKMGQGENNPQYGKCWIYNKELKSNKMVKKEELQVWLEQCWLRGREDKFYPDWEKTKASHQGINNSQYGTCWIYNEEPQENKRVEKEEVQFWLDKGWIKGRKIIRVNKYQGLNVIGKTNTKDKDGNKFRISVSDPRLLSGELVGITKGTHQSEETKEKMRETRKRIKFSQGEKNTQYGTRWIYNTELKKNKKVKKEEVQLWLDKGWIKGLKTEYHEKIKNSYLM